MKDFASLLATIRPLGASSPGEGTDAVLRFAKFFAGQLVETYGGVLA
jgi:hypothetical protein